MTCRACEVNLVMISSLASKWQVLKFGMPVFSGFMNWNWRPLSWNAGGSGNPPSPIPALWNIGILLHKQAIRTKHFDGECTDFSFKIGNLNGIEFKSPTVPYSCTSFLIGWCLPYVAPTPVVIGFKNRGNRLWKAVPIGGLSFPFFLPFLRTSSRLS